MSQFVPIQQLGDGGCGSLFLYEWYWLFSLDVFFSGKLGSFP